MRYNGTALASKRAVDQGKLVAFPNPTTGLVHLAISSAAQVEVYNATGRLCHKGEVSGTSRTVDLSTLPSGLYQLVIKGANAKVQAVKISKH
jgi:hypothetical protein